MVNLQLLNRQSQERENEGAYVHLNTLDCLCASLIEIINVVFSGITLGQKNGFLFHFSAQIVIAITK